MNWFSRREFLERSAILSSASVALGLAPSQAADETTAKKGSANDKLKVAVVGVRSRGMTHIGSAEKGKELGYLDPSNNCEIVAVCDADEGVIGNAMKKISAAQGAEPKFVKDFRKLIEDKSIDVISIATPNHWHATMAVWAMKAGKHVYCEKPATHNVREGRIMTDTSRSTKKLCQVGTQSRSNPGMQKAIQYIHDGKIGKVSLAYGTCYKRRETIGDVGKMKGEQAPPKSMDYDLWSGPARVLPPMRNGKFGSVHYDWHWLWEYGNGDFGNQGVHEADKARWGLKANGMPTSAVSVGGRFGYSDDGETPNTQLCLYEYAEGQMLFETRGLETKGYKGCSVGNIWFGDKGYVVCPNYSSGIAYDPDGKELAKFSGGGDQFHFRNFISAVRSGKSSDLNCDVEEGHYSAAICHLGNLSYRLGREAKLNADVKAFAKSAEAESALGRMLAHLADNKVDLTSAMGQVGARLSICPKSDTILEVSDGADVKKANAMLFREYRKGFDIEQKV